MATRSPLDNLQSEASCSICLGYFQDPVSIPCGHNFCRECITRCWEGLEGNFPCPQCRKTASHKNFRPSRELANIAGIARQLSLHASDWCKQHREALKLFCKEDQEPICALCDASQAHRSHTVLPAHQAAQEYKEEIQARLQASKEEREKYLESRKAGGRTSLYLEKTKKEGKRIVCEFEQLQRFLKEQERFLLVQLAELDQAITKVQEDAVTKVLEETSHLDTLIWEMEGKFQQPDSKFLLLRGDEVQPSGRDFPQSGKKTGGLSPEERPGEMHAAEVPRQPAVSVARASQRHHGPQHRSPQPPSLRRPKASPGPTGAAGPPGEPREVQLRALRAGLPGLHLGEAFLGGGGGTRGCVGPGGGPSFDEEEGTHELHPQRGRLGAGGLSLPYVPPCQPTSECSAQEDSGLPGLRRGSCGVFQLG
ncbi:zinc finger protein RFP-like isoform X2 [Numida meleagris]|uniref:zinc finger protein RFP-like isoform X2 n=1 Tax=Numida meleagris TaxID=8996 RepID=UPI000B3DFBFF|nr:zinc finger protein RFP-like isoform X2 [Numida meleagris]